MNFLLRSAQPIAAEQPSLNDFIADGTTLSRPLTTLEGLASDDPFPRYDDAEDCIGVGDVAKGLDGTIAGPSTRTDAPGVDKHTDVSEDEGWITIPCNELPEDWMNSLDTHSLRALDRNFVFPGEQVRILAYLSSYEQETEVITPFKVAAVMSRNGIRQTPTKEKENGGDGIDLVSGNGKVDQDKQNVLQNGNTPSKGKADLQQDISAGASLLRKEDQKRKTARLVQRLKSSYFFVRIAESGEMLWSKKGASKKSLESSDLDDQGSATNGASKSAKEVSDINTIVDKGNFNANVSGGVARNNVQCCSLANGDVVVLLQINVGVDLLSDPVIEILQFEKHQSRTSSLKNHGDLLHAAEDPSGGLLTWLLPVENTLPPPTVRPPSPPPALGSPGIGSTSGRSNFSAASSGSQIFSFGNLRSYSMSAIPQSSIPPSTATGLSSKSNSFDIGEWDQFSKQKPVTSENTSKEELLSFRTVSLEPERFSVRCGLEGIYIPGRRWRRKLEIIQPIQIQSFAADCNSDDLLSVQIKNVSPAHIPGVVVYIDSITIVLDEAAKGGGPPLSFPIASVEPGEDYGLPNLALRRDEEHSFILKPAISAWKKLSTQDRSTVSSQPPTKTASTLLVSSKIVEEKSSSLPTDQYAVVVSCHCNYSESRLFFKQPSSWRPHISRDIMISVAAEMTPEPNANASQLPVQVLTLQASNLTPEDLTMTILAPASFTSPPTVVSLNSSPSSPLSPVFGLAELQGTENHKKSGSTESKSISSKDQVASVPDAILNNDVGCTHLWLHSRVPLGCVPSQTTATIKLEVLPLTDGIITLDTLQIDVKEKGVTYVPEHSLKINATWSISTGIV